MSQIISSAKFEILKRQATRAKKTTGISHGQALDQVAIEHGFSNWSLLAKSVGIKKPYTIDIYCAISRSTDGSEQPSFWVAQIPCLYPPKHYAGLKWMPYKMNIQGRSRANISERIATVQRAIDFMDETGLKTSRAWTSMIRGIDVVGFDHTCVWRDNQKRLIVTTEPYSGNRGKISQLEEWCKRNEWQMARSPKKMGIWNPCTEACKDDCTTHTNLFILAPKKNGGNVKKVLSDIC